MKHFIIMTSFLLLLSASCSKDSGSSNGNCNCSGAGVSCATIVQVASRCDNFGIRINGQEYPSGNIPDEFKVVGKKVCIMYSLYEDTRLCPCCGGTWADITSITSSD